MQFRVTDLMINAATKKKKSKAKVSRYCCGKPGTCFRCTKCTSTAISEHKSPVSPNVCNVVSEWDIRSELLAQLRAIIGVSNEGELVPVG